jgi:hypothetical protein
MAVTASILVDGDIILYWEVLNSWFLFKQTIQQQLNIFCEFSEMNS